jgi:ABC-type multidrug transport system permease subunit
MKTQTTNSKPSFLSRLGWVVMAFLAVMVSLVVSRYLTLNPDVFFPEQKLVYMAHIGMLLMHIIGAMLAILIGPFQFLDGMKKGRLLKIHRWLGRTYLLSVLFGGLGGLYMAPLAHGGVISQLGFTALAILWLFSGFMAYKHIRNKEIEQHREWMTRNYALTFAGVMLRLWMPTLVIAGVDFTAGYIVIAWLCWVPNLAVAQWIINRRRKRESGLVESKLLQVSNRGQETA